MYDEWTPQDFSSPVGEVLHDPGDVGVPQILFADQTNARGIEADFDIGTVIGADPDLTFLLPDDFLIVGGKTFDTGPLATDVDGDGVDDGDTVDEIVVIGVRTPAYDPPVIPEYDGGGTGPYDPGGGGEVGGGGVGQDPLEPPQIPEVQQSFLDALREFINQNREREEVGDRNANSRFDRDPRYQTTRQVGNTTVYYDTRTLSFWFDSDGQSAVETEFWIYPDGVWYDYNNDGQAETRVVTF